MKEILKYLDRVEDSRQEKKVQHKKSMLLRQEITLTTPFLKEP